RRARSRGRLSHGLRSRRRGLSALLPRRGPGDLWRPGRRRRARRPDALGIAARRLLRVERRRAAEQRHPGGPRDLAALHPDRILRRRGRQRPVSSRAVSQRRRRRADLAAAAHPGARPARPAARPRALGERHDGRGVSRHRRAATVPGARPGRLRGQPAPLPRGCAPRRRGAPPTDTEIVFDLASRLGLGAHFWNGDVDAAYRHQLGPSGVSLEALRDNPAGVRVPLQTCHRKYADRTEGVPKGFATPTRKIELYSETLLEHGYSPLPEYEEPLIGPRSRPDLVERYPLVLTCAKHTQFCQSQHRGLPSLRRRALDPEVDLHPADATDRGLRAGDWAIIETPEGRIRA